jgi:hypothetical protein
MPKSVVVAVIGIVLSSWLIPAFTRQWDDRQKAGELKATLVAEMATATGRALLDAQAYANSNVDPSRKPDPKAVREWSVAALEIRARLDAYFGPDAVADWAVVSEYVRSTLSRAYGERYIPGHQLHPDEELADLYFRFYQDDSRIDDLVTKLLDEEEQVARSILDMPVRGYSMTWHDIASDLIPAV